MGDHEAMKLFSMREFLQVLNYLIETHVIDYSCLSLIWPKTWVKMSIARRQYAWVNNQNYSTHQRLNKKYFNKNNKIWFEQWLVGMTCNIQNQFIIDYFKPTDIHQKNFSTYLIKEKLTNKNLSKNWFNKLPHERDLVIWGTNLGSTVREGRLTIQEREMIKLPLLQYSVVVGLLLSDGWLVIASSTNINPRLGLSQSLDHSKYIWFVFYILIHYCNNLPVYRLRRRVNKSHWSVEIVTRALPCFFEIYSLFYIQTSRGKVKIVPDNIYDLLTPVALAHLIMGDGSAKPHGLVICTDSYSIDNIVKLTNVLVIRYRLDCTIRNHTCNTYRIYIKQRSMSLLSTIVRPHMHSSMLYKLGESKANYSNFNQSKKSLNNLLIKSKDNQIKNIRFKEWLVGFTDSHGTFSIAHQNGKWSLVYKIAQSRYNLRALFYIKKQLGVGSITKDNTKGQFFIRDRKKLQAVILPIFDKYPLLTSKQFNYLRFKQAFNILENACLTKDEKNKMLFWLKNKSIPENYVSPSWLSANLPLKSVNDLNNIMTKAWLVGFIEAEGSFYLVNKEPTRIVHGFGLTQKLDSIVLEAIKYMLHIPTYVKLKSNHNHYILDTTNSRAIENIINYFHNTMKGMKSVEYRIWARSYAKDKGNYNKLSSIREIVRKLRTKLLEISDFNQ